MRYGIVLRTEAVLALSMWQAGGCIPSAIDTDGLANSSSIVRDIGSRNDY